MSCEQVEQAAAVFSLKLDSGHELMCPWVNNECDEALIFPPPTPQVLIDSYRERVAVLQWLTALPVVSSSAIHSVRTSELEHFISQHTTANTEYHQALKVISLFGWEPRLLSYAVDIEGQASKSRQGFVEQMDGHISGGVSGVEVGNNKHPCSLVFDCRLCGACVGLWAFSTVRRPLEIFFSNLEGETGIHVPLGNLELPKQLKLGEFDPIRQHRTFCPWIGSEDTDRVPGWKLTLSALIEREKGSEHLDFPPASLNEPDVECFYSQLDPWQSIPKLNIAGVIVPKGMAVDVERDKSKAISDTESLIACAASSTPNASSGSQINAKSLLLKKPSQLKRKKRKDWLPEEEKALQDEVEKLSKVSEEKGFISWTTVHKNIKHLLCEGRRPVHLKDKWRNML